MCSRELATKTNTADRRIGSHREDKPVIKNLLLCCGRAR
jgi:hypothetical protein